MTAYSYAGGRESELYHVTVNGTAIPVGVVPEIGDEECARRADEYRRLPDYCWVDANRMNCHIAHGAGTGPVEIRVELDR